MTSVNREFTRGGASPRPQADRILYVDPDEEAGRHVAASLVAVADRVRTATTVAEALSFLEDRPVDCLISEYTLPDGDGLSLLETIRERDESLPFVLYTDAGSEGIASAAISAGVTEYVTKTDPAAGAELEATVEDVLEERTVGDNPTREADEFQTLVEDIADHAIFLLDRAGHVVSWNSGAENIKGYTEDEIIGTHFSVFYPNDEVERGTPSELLATARADGRVETEGWRVRKDGSRFFANVVITALHDDTGAVRGFAKFTRDLTDQRQREERLRREHELTERLLQAIPVGVVIHDAHGNLLRANARAEDILHITTPDDDEPTAEAAYDVTLYDVDGEPLDDSVHPVQQALTTGDSVIDREMIIERSDGQRVHVSVNSVPLYDEDGELERVITAGQDISALKEREQRLHETQQELERTVEELQQTNRELTITQNRFEALTKNSSFAVITIDGTSTIQFVNETIESIFGYEPDELVGTPITRLMPEELGSEHRAAVDRYLETGERQLDWEWVELPGEHKNGRKLELGLSFGDTTVEGDHLFTGVIRDITEQKARRRELDRRREELNELVAELERSNAELDQFAYMVSHDLKEPLRTVSSYLQLLEHRYGDDLDEDASEYIDFAVDGANRMKRLIEDILAFSRVGQDESAHESVDCNEVIEDVTETLSIEEVEDVEVHVEPLPTVTGNWTQLTTVFQNLIGNAITHSGDDVTVRVAAERDDTEWRFTVTDDGPGIPPEHQEHVFDMFNSVGPSGGTGVGLAICQKVIEHHGGTIRVESTPGEGTIFSFTLPACDHEDAEDAA